MTILAQATGQSSLDVKGQFIMFLEVEKVKVYVIYDTINLHLYNKLASISFAFPQRRKCVLDFVQSAHQF